MSEPVGPGPNTGLPLDARASWLFTALFLLTAATGMVDATSFLGLGQVFTANMTGNVLLLGFAVSSRAVAHQYGLSAVGGLISLAAFTAGAVIGGLAAGRRSRAPRLAMALVVEWVVLVGATVLVGVDPHPGTEARFVAIALLAMAMGVQNATVRRMGVPDVNTTVLTTTLGGLAADVVEVGGRPARAGRRVATVVLIFVGAALGAVAEQHGLVWSSLAALTVATAAMLALFRAGALRSVRS